MAKVTKEQYKKWNEQLENGWFLDLQRLVIWGEKDIRITDKISDTEYVDYTVSFWENYENHRSTGTFDIKLTKREWKKSENTECYVSTGLGCSKLLVKDASTKKLYKLLVEISKNFTLEDVKALYTGNEVNPMS